LNIVLAGTGVGKSLAMCHFAADNLRQNKNVLYITLEMSEKKIAERIDANLLDVQIDQIENLPRDIFKSKVSKIQEKTRGRLIIKEYPTATAHVGHFRALIDELRMKKDFAPDVIYIDYLNICASSRIKGLGGSINTYSYVKAIAEELRGLAGEFDVPIWSATQVTRTGFGNTDVELTDTSESFGLPATADLMVALISTEKLEGLNQIMVKQLKNRYNDPTQNKRFVVGVDRSKMRLYDVEDSAQTLTSDGSGESNDSSKNSHDFSSFKI
jgi:replicative DNA helicase